MKGYDDHSDQELLQLLKADDQRAMTAIIKRYWDRMLAVAINRLDSQEDAEECVQDVFVRLWKLRNDLILKYTLYTYLSAAVRYGVYNRLDKQHRKFMGMISLTDQDISSGEFHADSRLLEKELLEQISAYVDLLPEKCRIVYRMSREQGMSNGEIAQDLNIAEKTVEAHLTKAVKNIHDNLGGSATAITILMISGDIHRFLS